MLAKSNICPGLPDRNHARGEQHLSWPTRQEPCSRRATSVLTLSPMVKCAQWQYIDKLDQPIRIHNVPSAFVVLQTGTMLNQCNSYTYQYIKSCHYYNHVSINNSHNNQFTVFSFLKGGKPLEFQSDL